MSALKKIYAMRYDKLIERGTILRGVAKALAYWSTFWGCTDVDRSVCVASSRKIPGSEKFAQLK